MKKLVCIVLAAFMAVMLLPLGSLAHSIGANAEDAKMLQTLARTWEAVEAVESELLQNKASSAEVAMGVYRAALNNRNIDEGSLVIEGPDQFTFTVEGMLCVYCYRIRNTEFRSSLVSDEIRTAAEAAGALSSNGPTHRDVLIVGPYYGHPTMGQSFTDQYVNEGASLAQITGGDCTVLSGEAATGPAIAEAYTDKAVVIYDSHGIDSSGSTYLIITNSDGIEVSDYVNHYAISAGAEAGIDGRYIREHAPGRLSNTFVWMAICSGMRTGVTGSALLEAGAGAVFGYSDTVSFDGDYNYEAVFWSEIKNGAAAAEAFAAMCASCDFPDRSGAYPVLMSPTDPFPEDPAALQPPTCDWELMGASGAIPLESYSLSDTAISVCSGFTETVLFSRIPDNANNYTLVWGSEDSSVASVTGSSTFVHIEGGVPGTTRIYCDIYVEDCAMGRAYCTVNVFECPTLNEAVNVEGASNTFTSATSDYPWTVDVIDGRIAARSTNYHVDSSTSTMQLVLDMEAGETLSFEWKVSCDPNDRLIFYVNGAVKKYINYFKDWATYTYTAPSSGTYTFQWTYQKNENYYYGMDCGYVDNVTYSGDGLVIPTPTPGPDPTPTVYYTVTFADWDGAVLSARRVAQGGSAVAPASPERTGYTFTGWNGSYTNVTSDVTVTAGYSVNSYTLTVYYDYADGSKAAETYHETLEYGSSYSVQSPTVEGCTPDMPVVSGVMGAANVTITVTYTAGGTPGGLPGDADCSGDVSFADISCIYLFLLGSDGLSPQGKLNADFDGDGGVGFGDVSTLYIHLIS